MRTSHPQVVERCRAILGHLESCWACCYRFADKKILQSRSRLEEERYTDRRLRRAVVGNSTRPVGGRSREMGWILATVRPVGVDC